MFAKIATITLFATMAVTSTFAQRRDFRREREQLAREEREEKRRWREEREEDDREMVRERPRISYGTNIVRVSPLTVMDVGVGFGLSYEKIFGQEGMVGLVLPVYLMLEDQNNFDPFYNQYYNDDTRYSTYVFFNPGLKIYPFGQRRVTYAVGPSLLLGYGSGSEWRYDNALVYQEKVDVTKLRIGMLVNNYVSFNITKGFNLGLEAGIGVRYIDRETYDSPTLYHSRTYNNGINVTGNFSLTLGFRF